MIKYMELPKLSPYLNVVLFLLCFLLRKASSCMSEDVWYVMAASANKFEK